MAEREKMFVNPWTYYVIYVYSIAGSKAHGGVLKVGDTDFKSSLPPSAFPPNSPELAAAAKKRIKEQTNTAGIAFDLLHVELALREVRNGNAVLQTVFRDHAVHAVLENSGFKHVKMPNTTAREWYRIDLRTAIAAIKAVKDGRASLDSSEVGARDSGPFPFRPEQIDAIDKTVKRFKTHKDMLWDAKMRFGKTPTALEVVRRCKFRRTIIITHRPVVGTSWEEDFPKIFRAGETPWEYVDKSKLKRSDADAKEETAKNRRLRQLVSEGKNFIYFASIQDLRGSKRVGGKYLKNEGVFDVDWDLVIVDEAHEGTQTELGRDVTEELVKRNTRKLDLSGTPFNIRTQYEENAICVWDYTMEQAAKAEWEKNHPDEPNPYAVLPRMNIFTYDLSEEMRAFSEEDLDGKAFNFAEFFRTEGGKFVHASDVRKFLDLISADSASSRYPFATDEYRGFFRHTLWMVPGVEAGAALEAMLMEHPVFRTFGIANVAGEGDRYEDDHYDDALDKVRRKIAGYDRTITISCGRLTTGVTVPEWTAVLMLAGSVHTSAASYMQTIFRVQSPGVIDGRQKEECFVFDFAPDRTLTVLAETAQLSRRVSKNDASEERGRKALGEFLNFCPVIAIDGGRAKPYDVGEMMKRLKRVFVLRAIRNGFDDSSIYSDKLLKMSNLDLMKFEHLKGIVGSSKQTEAPRGVDVNGQGFDEEDWERNKEEAKRKGKDLSEEERKRLEELRKARERKRNAISILRAISIRMPLLIYGAEVDFNEKISIGRFVEIVDDASWEEFMPKGVTKALFKDYIQYYDADIFEQAGLEIRKLARAADKMLPGERIAQIAQVFSYFKNPDKETVLTPWRVVNMHLSDMLGGWSFYEENPPVDAKPLDEPRMVGSRVPRDRRDPFAPDARILEINSKSGLYPLYCAYSIYRARLAGKDLNPLVCWREWRRTLAENVFVVCKTPMAAAITRRTLAGYLNLKVNARCYDGDIVATLKETPQRFVDAVKSGAFWGRKEKDMKFDAVVGNPPYQEDDGGFASSASPVYHLFVDAATALQSRYVTLITPSRWFVGGKGLDDFRSHLLSDHHLRLLVDFPLLYEPFRNVKIRGGISYFLWDGNYNGPCSVTTMEGGKPVGKSVERDLDEFDILVRRNEAVPILRKVREQKEKTIDGIISSSKPFGLRTFFKGADSADGISNAIRLYGNQDITWVDRSSITTNAEWIDEWKVLMTAVQGTSAAVETRFLSNPIVAAPGTACTETYLVAGHFGTKSKAKNLANYLRTRFARFLVSLRKATQHATRDVYAFVPLQDFTAKSDIDWSRPVPEIDAQLYAKYGITAAEVRFIESMVKPME